MSPLAVLLVLASAIVHVAWNALGKRERPSAAFFAAALGCGLLGMCPLMAVYGDVIPQMSAGLWLLLALTGLFQAFYYIMLAAAYCRGYMSMAYPLTRPTTVLFMAGMSSSIKGCGAMSLGHVAGLAFITFGGPLLPLRSRADL